MSNFLRPEAVRTIKRWTQAIVGVAVTVFGLWVFVSTFGFVKWFGAGVAVLGLSIMIEGTRRARLAARMGSEIGVGMVDIDERQISWLTAEWGGAVSIDQLASVAIRIDENDDMFWQLTQKDGERLTIPANATGAEEIMDALSALPSLNYDAAVSAINSKGAGVYVLWRTPIPHNEIRGPRPLT
ncbi:hypothetical protein BVC71_00740 [Marivivens niveibacter]|uniref:Uncharacterized protein n=1 Tax=Marivivens niveibacter TaxID=1930667 RepID=A0A251X109_9RHOB|nr:hypothetical protein [Marivivens niveibacter]OUD10078.1 hypothetical protein BVC71_00740 [Marivivens niveibacter]